MKKLLIALVLVAMLCSCATVTVKPNGGAKLKTSPQVTEREHFFLWGLIPKSVDVVLPQHCNGRMPSQFQAQTTFIDGLLGAVTFGIYAPRSYRIWCS